MRTGRRKAPMARLTSACPRMARPTTWRPACYDREYLFQFSEIDPKIHRQAEEQASKTCPVGSPAGCMGRHRALPSRLLHDQRAFDADDMDTKLCRSVSTPAVQRQPAHASGRIGPAENYRARTLAASLPRTRQSRARAGARWTRNSERDGSNETWLGHCSSPLPRLAIMS